MRTFLNLVISCLVGLVLCGCGAGGGGGTSSAAPATTSVERATTALASTPVPTTGTLSTASAGAPVYVGVYVHCEDKHHPATPDFSIDKTSYVAFRNAIIHFATVMQSRNLAWNWQSDYNFLEACRTYEVTQADPSLLASTGGMNVVRWLHDTMGVEIDPHSHEADGYNYADVAYLITQCGVTPSPVVGGHINDASNPNFQNWPKFIGGLQGSRYPQYTFTPTLLMGGASPGHTNDATFTGMWRPTSATDFFTHSPSGAIASFGCWDSKVSGLSEVIARMQSGTLSPTQMWTAGVVFNQSDMTTSGYTDATIAPQLDTLATLRSQGAVEVVHFTEATSIWQGQYGGTGSLFTL